MKKEKSIIAYERKIKTESKYFKRRKIPKNLEEKKEIEYRIMPSCLNDINLVCIKDSRFSRYFTQNQISELITFLNERIKINKAHSALNIKNFLIAKKNQLNKINLPALHIYDTMTGEWNTDEKMYYNYTFIYPKTNTKLSKLIDILQTKIDHPRYSREIIFLSFELETRFSFEI